MDRRGAGAGLGALAWPLGLPQLLALAFVLRVAVMAIATPVHPDEVFQYLEPAHRLLFGHGVVTWEQRAGMRAWLLPVLVSLPMGLGGWIAPRSGLHILLPGLAMAAASLGVVWAAWRLGERVSPLHARLAAFAAATWSELVYFAPHAMSETAAVDLTLPAAALLLERE